MITKTKKMDESAFAKIVKEFNAVGELIRERQDEKQAVMDAFDSESKRFYFGKISEKTLASSVRKANSEVQKLDGQIRATIAKAGELAIQAKRFASAQSPKPFKATLSGVIGSGKKRKNPTKKRKAPKRKPAKKAVKKPVKKKVVKRKPVAKKKSSKKR